MEISLYDFRWQSEDNFEFQGSQDGVFGKKQLSFGDSLSLKIVSDIRCAGSIREKVFQPCPHQEEGKRKCDLCRGREGNFVITSFDGFNMDQFTSEDLNFLKGEHLVYLAFFSKDLIKIGVCRKERLNLRQIEQGAFGTLFIAETPDGVLARKIETLFRRSGIVDKVQNRQKNAFFPSETVSGMELILKETLETHYSCLDEALDLKKYLLGEASFFRSWEEVYHLSKIRNTDKQILPIKIKTGESVSGTIVGVRGSFIFLETEDTIFLLSGKEVLGHGVSFDPLPPGVCLQTALQGALF